MLISVLTGFAAGALHVVGGADHLVAMAPSSLKSPAKALKGGMAWGLGHSTGVLLLSGLAILFKDIAQIEKLSTFAEFTVGLLLLVIGALAIRSSLGFYIHSHKHMHDENTSHKHLHMHFRGDKGHLSHSHAATSLGVLHGLAGASHLLAVIPALALPAFGAVLYMTAFLFGSVAAMGAFVLVISNATVYAGRRRFPVIIGLTGGLSVVTGFFWLQKTSALIF
ncbi:hydantoin utilization protein A [Prochlorococcus sp. MIT 1300]|uniref:hydantoin utilization protein A n=1 Tax=Prochlorococcus sp. MIT 1300 TaxID=3096218 RepID=UPI002A74BC1E|nr:hydantoin utilization protein A [Prochlorococcus sp. MIT 1300]